MVIFHSYVKLPEGNDRIVIVTVTVVILIYIYTLLYTYCDSKNVLVIHYYAYYSRLLLFTFK